MGGGGGGGVVISLMFIGVRGRAVEEGGNQSWVRKKVFKAIVSPPANLYDQAL